MAQIEHGRVKGIFRLEDLQSSVVDLDLKIVHQNENIRHLEMATLTNKLKICNEELKTTRSVISSQENEIKSLKCRNDHLERLVANNDASVVHQKDSEVCQKKVTAHVLKENERLVKIKAVRGADNQGMLQMIDEAFHTNKRLEKQIQDLRKHICTLESEKKNRDIEIAQIEFRNRLLDDASKKNKASLQKDISRRMEAQELNLKKTYLLREIEHSENENRNLQNRLSDAIHENGVLEIEHNSLQQKNQETQYTISQIRSQNQRMQMFLNTLYTVQKELDGKIKELQELIDKKNVELNRLKPFLKVKEKPELESIISLKISQCKDEFHTKIEEKEEEIFHLNHRLDEYLKQFKQREADMKHMNYSLHIQVNKLESALKQREQEIEDMKGHTLMKIYQNETESKDETNQIHRKLKNTETELEKCKRDIEYERKQASTTKMQMEKMIESNKNEINQLKFQMSEKETEIQRLLNQLKKYAQLQEENETIVNDRINNKNKYFQYEPREEKKGEFPGKNSIDRTIPKCITKEGRTFESVNEAMSDLIKANRSLHLRLREAEAELDKLNQDIEHEKRKSNATELELAKTRREVESLNEKIMKKERELEMLRLEFKNCCEQKNETEQKLNETISEFSDKRDQETTEKENEAKQIDKLKNEICKAHERETILCESVYELKNRIQEKTNEILELTHQLNKMEKEKLEIERETEEFHNHQMQMANMSSEIEHMKLELRNKEIIIQKQDMQTQISLKLTHETEAKLEETVNKQRTEIEHLCEKIRQDGAQMKSDELVLKRNEHHLEKLLASQEDEAKLRGQNSELLSIIKEKDVELSKLNQQLYLKEEKLNQTDAELKDKRHTLQLQMKNAEDDLKHRKEEFEYDNEQHSKTMRQMSNDIQRLENELKENYAALKENHVHTQQVLKQKDETESNLTGIIKKQNISIRDLQMEISDRKLDLKKKDLELERIKQRQETLKITLTEEDEIRKKISTLETENKEKSDQIDKLKYKLIEMREKLHQGESNSQDITSSLQRELKHIEAELEISKRESKFEQEQSKNMQEHIKEKIEEIESLKRDVRKLEITSQDHHVQFLNAVKEKVEAERERNYIIENQSRKMKLLQDDVEKKESYIKEIGQANKLSDHVQEELVESHKREVLSLMESIYKLQNKNQENEEQISQLKQQISKNIGQKEIELQQALSVQVKLDKSEKEIEQLKRVIENEKEQSNRAKEILQENVTENERLKLEIHRLNERTENALESETKFESISRTLQTQLKSTEKKLKHCELEISHNKEMVISADRKNKDIECLNVELKEKEASVQNYLFKYQGAVKQKENIESTLNELINKQKSDIEHLQEKIYLRDIKIKKYFETVNELQSRNQEQAKQITDLKHQLDDIKEILNRRETEFKSSVISLKDRFQKAETEVEISNQENKHEKKQACRTREQMKEKNKEIERLKLQVQELNKIAATTKETEAKFENMIHMWKDSVKQKEITESKLNKIINTQGRQIQQLQEEIDQRKIEITNIDEVKLKNEHIEHDLHQSHERETALRENNEVIQVINKRNENQITLLTKQMNEFSERSVQKESKLKKDNDEFKKKVKSLETDLEQLRREHSKEERNSKSAQMKISEMGKEIGLLVNEKRIQERENKIKKGIIDSQEQRIEDLENAIQEHEKKIKDYDRDTIKERKAMENKMAELKDQQKQTLAKLHNAKSELDETKSRLSRVMGDRLTDNNPNITDLSDRNRPTKIAEKCAELYDNQWTDAYDVLEKHFREEDVVIEVLLHILQDAMTFCKTMAKRQTDAIKRELNFATKQDGFEVSSDMQKVLKDHRKAMASSVVGNLYKLYVSELKQSKDKVLRAALDVDEYTAECIEICWFMVVQDPPVVFGPLPKKGTSFDTNFYKPYTRSGTHVDYSVWPSLLLHEGGPILAKGVAQGYGKR